MAKSPNKNNRLTLFIILAMVAGVALGYALNRYYAGMPPANTNVPKDQVGKVPKNVLDYFSLLADIFLRLIKMIVSPLVFTTLVVGVAKQGNIKAIGRVGGKTLLWFLGGTFISLFLGMVLVNYFHPGTSIHAIPDPGTDISKLPSMSVKDFVTHIFPKSIFDAMAQNELLQVVVFSIFFGVATAAIGEQGNIVIRALDAIAHIILRMTGYIMNFAPIAVFGAMTAVIAQQGLGILSVYGKFIGEFYFGLFILMVILLSVCYLFIRRRVFSLLNHIREPALTAFSTASSEAAFPKLLLELQRFGCEEKVVSFVLPLGYSFNLDGSMMYMSFASIFIAQYYGIHLNTGTQVTMLLVLMITSKGIAGVPRASLVVITGTLATFKIPEVGIALIFGIDPILDMGRAAMNVVGNSVATVAVSKWEGMLKS